MSDKLLTTKSIIAIGIPLTVIGLQGILRYAANTDFNSIGVTLSSIGIGQIFPFIVFENFLLSKVFAIKENAVSDGNSLVLTYSVEKKETNDMKDIRLLSYIFLLVNIILFCFTVVLSIKGNFYSHLFTGLLSCAITWYYTIKI